MSGHSQAVATKTTSNYQSGKANVCSYLKIARFDHWVKNVFVLPGIWVALGFDRQLLNAGLLPRIVFGMIAVGLVASSNYVLNEVLDAPFDLHHPTKRFRPVPSGEVKVFWAYVEWIGLMLLGLGIALLVSRRVCYTLGGLWAMGLIYNVPPIRTKEMPYLDVLSEAINNPIRMLTGWYIVGTALIPPISLLMSYWMVGCYFMAIKRFAEYRDIADRFRSAAYRKSFAYYNEPRLLVSIMFYGTNAMLFFGAFLMRYHLELILSFPLVALVMAVYLSLAFKNDSAAQNPEGLYREPLLMSSVIACTVVMAVLLFVKLPRLHRAFEASIPVIRPAMIGH
jgi:decaprenyl-phosphate phosphoribosyltransferase